LLLDKKHPAGTVVRGLDVRRIPQARSDQPHSEGRILPLENPNKEQNCRQSTHSALFSLAGP
jgi:hypothetical protein